MIRLIQYETGCAPIIGGAAFSCDLAVYGEVGKMPSILLGPRGDHLHAPDEWMEIQDLLDLTGIYATLAAEWCSMPSKLRVKTANELSFRS